MGSFLTYLPVWTEHQQWVVLLLLLQLLYASHSHLMPVGVVALLRLCRLGQQMRFGSTVTLAASESAGALGPSDAIVDLSSLTSEVA